MNNRTEMRNMAPFALAIPLSIIALAFAKAKIKINLVTNPESKTANSEPSNKCEPMNRDKKEAEDRAVFCFGTERLFEKRRKKYQLLNKATKFIGLFVPISLGFFAMSSQDPELTLTLMPIFRYLTTFLNAVILVISVWSMVAEWDAKIENYTESISNNIQYYKAFKEILERYDENPTEYASKLKEMILLDDIQQNKDGKESYSAKDYRFIMRQGLYQLQTTCAKCGEIPDIINPGTCSNCGK